MSFECLILTPWFAAHQSVAWQKSIAMDYTGEIDVLERYDETVSSPTVTIRIPAVGRLVKALPRVKRNVKFSRANVYQRDDETCQFCGRKRPKVGLNYDHVVPRSKGGKTTWENIVTACKHCNTKKDNRTPKEAGMRLLREPARPHALPLTPLFVLPKRVPKLWLPYLSDRIASLKVG